jgi:hypothetical protein
MGCPFYLNIIEKNRKITNVNTTCLGIVYAIFFISHVYEWVPSRGYEDNDNPCRIHFADFFHYIVCRFSGFGCRVFLPWGFSRTCRTGRIFLTVKMINTPD